MTKPEELRSVGSGTIHRCPPRGSARTPCCHAWAQELPRTDQLTEHNVLVTCTGDPVRWNAWRRRHP